MRLMIISHDNSYIQQAVSAAQNRFANVRLFVRKDEALSALRNGYGADLLMINVDQDIPGIITELRVERFAIPVVACGIGNNTKAAVEAIKAGALEFIPFPADGDLIAAVIEAIAPRLEETEMICHSPAMQAVLDMAKQVAGADASILITGESGTGKEVIARYIHQTSKRANQSFIAVNCAAIPEQLLESELFGHEKGAFTGALSRRVGKFEEANKGTLLLDEVTEMDIRLQPKLLRAIQERKIDRVGGAASVDVDIRIIATSNRDLKEAIRDGAFREDLFYRLNVINLQLPPLRRRKEDIVPLAQFFVQKYSAANSMKAKPLSNQASLKLIAYDWPGNVRELENTMHRAVLLASGDEIGTSAILLQQESADTNIDSQATIETTYSSLEASALPLVGRTIESVEKEMIVNTLGHCLGNRTQAAMILGISLRTLRNKLNAYKLEATE
ncbi:MAG: sigma-54-dependent Fis family transcriptional regulator [Alphaproteobacteria bacterium]|nr:sigma-54-dependent Fis family transcriptional regulator [Alphaproteobacteria bacterium]